MFQRGGVCGDVALTRGPSARRQCSAEHPLVGRGGFRDNAGMFLRRKNKKARGVGYSYWHLCETVRTARGPRQRVVASLGKLDEAEVAGLRGGWDDLTALLRGEAPARSPAARTAEVPGLESAPSSGSASTPSAVPSTPAVQWERAEVSGLRVERTRDFGESYLGLALWHRLKLDELLAGLLPAGRESVAWSHVAALLTVARFCAQRSELGVAEHWYDTTALDDLLGVDTGLVNDARLYRALDQLGAHKDALCAHLMTRYREWFGVRFEFLLYDVTSTYFEGQAEGNPQAQRGYSRDQRSGNKQVCIGLVCTPEGLPLSFETFAGNRADVTTVEEIVASMEKNTASPSASGSWTAAWSARRTSRFCGSAGRATSSARQRAGCAITKQSCWRSPTGRRRRRDSKCASSRTRADRRAKNISCAAAPRARKKNAPCSSVRARA